MRSVLLLAVAAALSPLAQAQTQVSDACPEKSAAPDCLLQAIVKQKAETARLKRIAAALKTYQDAKDQGLRDSISETWDDAHTVMEACWEEVDVTVCAKSEHITDRVQLYMAYLNLANQKITRVVDKVIYGTGVDLATRTTVDTRVWRKPPQDQGSHIETRPQPIPHH